ncbi:MAG: hypothetical protein Kow00128_16800 [Deltaproteobacteria bacterium]
MNRKGKDISGICRILSSALLLAAAGWIVSCARAPVKPGPVASIPPGRLGGALFSEQALGVSLEGAEVRVGDQAVKAGADGTFSFPGVPTGKQFLVAEKRFPSGAVRRVLGVSTVYVSDSPVQIRVRMRDATDVDAFCLDCHPMKKDVTRRDQIMRDVHPSGIVPKKANKPTGKYDEKGRVTCESCHTVHRDTGSPHFTLASFKDGRLCLQCH